MEEALNTAIHVKFDMTKLHYMYGSIERLFHASSNIVSLPYMYIKLTYMYGSIERRSILPYM